MGGPLKCTLLLIGDTGVDVTHPSGLKRPLYCVEHSIAAYVREDAKWSVESDAEISRRICLAPVKRLSPTPPGPSPRDGVPYEGFGIRKYSCSPPGNGHSSWSH